MMSELKPCPFCGARGSVEEEGPIGGYAARCGNCGSQTPIYLRADLAIKAWNTRAERTCTFEPESSGLLGQYKCSSCNDTVHVASLKVLKRLHYCPNCGARVDA